MAKNESTGMICRRCGSPVYPSDNAEYCYQCLECDEDLYSFEVEQMKKGCAFKVISEGNERYFTSDLVNGLADFARFLYENRVDDSGVPVPLSGRIPEAVELSLGDWMKIADDPHGEGRFACFFVADIDTNMLWVNEDCGNGMEHFLFPLTLVIEMAAFGTKDIWARLLAACPGAKMG